MIKEFLQVIGIFGATWFLYHMVQWYLRKVRPK